LQREEKKINFPGELSRKSIPMERILFNNTSFDIDYLNDAYADDAETAASVFEQYLEDLPKNQQLLAQSYHDRDLNLFRQVIHKQKPGFSYVGLTDVTQKFQELLATCNTIEDMDRYKPEVEKVIERIDSTATAIRGMLTHLHSFQ
jgi:hypothetical protein